MYKNKIIERLKLEDKHICEIRKRNVLMISLIYSCRKNDMFKVRSMIRLSKIKIVKTAGDQHILYRILYIYKNFEILYYLTHKKLIDPLSFCSFSNYTILHKECKKKNPKLLLYFLKNPELDVNIRCKGGENAWSPIYLPLVTFNIKILEALLSHPLINVNLRTDNGWTPLHFACSSSCEDDFDIKVVKLLLSHPNININALTVSGQTPLYNAIHSTFLRYAINYNLVNLLISKGADINIVNNKGNSLLNIALNKSDNVLVKILLKSDKLKTDIINGIRSYLFIFGNFEGYDAFKLLLNDVRYNKDNVYKIFERFYVTDGYKNNFVRHLLINGFVFDLDKLKCVIGYFNKHSLNLVEQLINEYSANKDECDVMWRLRIYYKLTHCAKAYCIINNLDVNNLTFSDEICRFIRILKCLNDDVKQLICCIVFELKNRYIPTFFLNNYHLLND